MIYAIIEMFNNTIILKEFIMSFGAIMGVLGIILWIWAVVEIFKSTKTAGKKFLWLLVVTFIPFGAILFFLLGREKEQSLSPDGDNRETVQIVER